MCDFILLAKFWMLEKQVNKILPDCMIVVVLAKLSLPLLMMCLSGDTQRMDGCRLKMLSFICFPSLLRCLGPLLFGVIISPPLTHSSYGGSSMTRCLQRISSVNAVVTLFQYARFASALMKPLHICFSLALLLRLCGLG
jgi:hypothetical protein